MNQRIAVVTNVLDYAGPPVVAALTAQGVVTICHSDDFRHAGARTAYMDSYPDCIASPAHTPEGLVAEAVARFGRVDVAISNDIGDLREGEFTERTADDFRDLLEAFAIHPARLAMAAAPPMREQGGGVILFVTSGAPLATSSGMSIYGASRAAANALVRSLARELGPDGISVNAVAPFFLDSNYLPNGMDDPMVAERVRSSVPLQRLGRPEEIGALISLLVSGQVNFVSGQVIAFSGGGV
ncbi:SDR family oxidoreductase [Rhodococcus sp. IEGM 1307]|uniref:SDR family oxidoreductase n=1 Tax=Rhodococcus sp. IEGM 1307 TaxID=3047091 RepID=UPI0024B74D62|nr:SDR family oxidoreductase [Rhodococcus sp. IEGM 1307]MDI9979608.1 SDR family oxidoreductase [Rhodococcus sp. IEGM 1307]